MFFTEAHIARLKANLIEFDWYSLNKSNKQNMKLNKRIWFLKISFYIFLNSIISESNKTFDGFDGNNFTVVWAELNGMNSSKKFLQMVLDDPRLGGSLSDDIQ